MGYYENPPIINPRQNNIGAYIADAGNSIAEALIKSGERKRQEEKERKLSLEKLQQRKNEIDLHYNNLYSDWKTKQTGVQGDADNQIKDLIQQSITTAADDRLLLEQETDPKKRTEYLKSISDADVLLTGSGTFAKKLTGQVATYRLKTPSVKLGEIGGSIVNGKNSKEILDNTAALEVLGGNPLFVGDSKIDVKKNSTGDGLLLTVSGHHKDTNEPFEVQIDSNVFNKSDEESDNGLLIPVESNDAFLSDAKKTYFDEKGNNILSGFLLPTHETYDLDSKGTSGGNGRDIYQIKNGQRINTELIRSGVLDKAEISATSLLATYENKPARMRAFIGCTLKKGLDVYDEQFAKETPQRKKELLKEWMTEDAMKSFTKNLEKTTTKEGVIYWNPSPNIDIKQKPGNGRNSGGNGSGTSGGSDKEDYVPISSEDYDKIIQDYDSIIKDYNLSNKNKSLEDFATKVNNLATSPGKYKSREELYQIYLNQPYMSGTHDTGLTVKQAYKDGKIKINPSDSFRKKYGTSLIYSETKAGVYEPIKGYDFNKAADRVKFTLENTADKSDKKALVGKLYKAKLYDWSVANPQKRGESLQAYQSRASKSIK